WLTAVSVQAVAINAALTKIIAIPTVNTWLTHIGLGSVPKSVAKETAAATSQELQPAQYEPSTTDYRTEQGTLDVGALTATSVTVDGRPITQAGD
ncbi:hypothetical protein IAE22_30350, partial [Bacillus sp. S34]|nr:hypothetical protein [Bacillus sp. S34]